jgi:hypothetical protein
VLVLGCFVREPTAQLPLVAEFFGHARLVGGAVIADEAGDVGTTLSAGEKN